MDVEIPLRDRLTRSTGCFTEYVRQETGSLTENARQQHGSYFLITETSGFNESVGTG